MRNPAGRILRSREAGFLLILVLSFSVVELGVQLWPAIARRLAGTEPLIQPKMDGVEKVVKDHIATVRAECDRIVADGSAQPRQKSLAYGQLGKIYLAYTYPDAAIPCFRNAARLDPTEFRWPYLLANALDQHGQTKEAVRPMADAVRLMEQDVTSVPADRIAALCFLGQAAMRLNQPTEAKRTFEAVLTLAPGNLFALTKASQLAAQDGDGARAISLLQRAVARAPGEPVLRQLLSTEYRRQGNAARAEEFAVPPPSGGRKRAPIEYFDPLRMQTEALNRSGSQQNRIGLQLIRMGRFQDALTYYQRAAQMDPSSLPAAMNTGMTLLGLGRIEEARQILEDAQKRHPEAEGVRGALCLTYSADAGTGAKALEFASQWHQEKPDSLEALKALGEVSLRIGQPERAVRAFQEAAEKAPAETWPRLGEARALAASGQLAAARDRYAALFAEHRDDSEIQLRYARFLATCPDAKLRDGQRSLELSQALMKAQYSVLRAETVAVGLAETGHFREAVDLQSKAVEACADQAEASIRTRAREVLQAIESKRPWREKVPFDEAHYEVRR